ncbi:MAG: 16S rRNA methyltransferase [Spirochaetaceae bacterium]|jgi:16S rRNA (cytosine1407-C5)-methyltransferase|nr:16S rRNA methyltransferase [Spirochaetaceae bacterium]
MSGGAFDAYYAHIYGARWEKLRQALLDPVSLTAYAHNLKEAYHLDYASVLASQAVRLPDSGVILDACAAPGGKTLVLASRMHGDATLLANEISSERRRRLVNVLDRYAPPHVRNRIAVTGFDAAAAAARRSERERFGAILLDAPCSAERHVLRNPALLERWTPARPRFLSRRQWALLSSAFLLLRRGAGLVYATCAMSAVENDEVAERLLVKYQDDVSLDAPDFSEGQRTKYGRILLPDEGGAGPLYVARFWKRGAPSPHGAPQPPHFLGPIPLEA